ncbi:hypothetical protein ACFV2H_14115 [Streptomyces sp. NPDC059629]|uniref:hypothetical protein n=1 Tax=Streptomyces sp. NPDC059629 TaxID=3346889 RepID=UPI0036C0F4B3
MGTDLFQHIPRGIGDPFTDRPQRGRCGQHRARGRSEHVGQAVAHPARVTRVRHRRQPFHQARDLRGYDLRILTQLITCRCGLATGRTEWFLLSSSGSSTALSPSVRSPLLSGSLRDQIHSPAGQVAAEVEKQK